MSNKSFISELEEYCEKKILLPVYAIKRHNKDEWSCFAEGCSADNAKEMAAYKMLRILKHVDDYVVLNSYYDAIKEVYDYVIRYQIPMFVLHCKPRIFRNVGPLYEAYCQYSRVTKSELEARQRAAIEMKSHLVDCQNKKNHVNPKIGQ